MLKEKYGKEIDALLARYPDKRSAILTVMHLAQEEYGHMSKEAMQDVADVLDLDPTHVLSLTGFYSLFYEEPVGKYVLEICTDLACALRGADAFAEMACERLGVDFGEISEDGLFTVFPVMCLGACDRAPMLQCNLKFEENLDEDKFDALIDRLKARAESGEEAPSVVQKIVSYTRE